LLNPNEKSQAILTDTHANKPQTADYFKFLRRKAGNRFPRHFCYRLHKFEKRTIQRIEDMSGSPKFEYTPDHSFHPKEKIFVIDKNGFDIWEAEIVDIESGTFSVHYPAFPEDDEKISDSNRILVDTRVNRRIFNTQESNRQAQLPPLSEGEEEPFSDRDDDDDDAGDYQPASGSPRSDKKPKKGKKNKKSAKPSKPSTKRPEGVRLSPRRGG
jgi:hypothetical protein